MEKSLFVEFLGKYFPKLQTIVEKVNDTRKQQVSLFRTMLRQEYSADMKWESNAINSTIVAADVVAMDSALPLKKRDKISTANGDLPKLGMKMKLSEKQISDINIMKSRGTQESLIVSKILNDSVRCTNGIDERIEAMFLTGLSNGVALVEDSDNVGVGIRVDFGYPAENQFKATTVWNAANYTPISDMKRVIKAASDKGDTITHIAVSRETYDLIRHSQEGKELAAIYGGLVITSNVALPAATPTKFNEAFRDETGCDFIIVDRSVRVEKNGVQTSIRPFNGNRCVFLTSQEVGTLYYGTLAEETNPVPNVEYSKPTAYTLVKKYLTTDPFAEMTASQAMVLPVIENVDQIYTLAIDEADIATLSGVANPDILEVDATAEGADTNDVYVTLWNAKYNKSDVIAALATLGVTLPANSSDSKIVGAVNKLSAAKVAALKAAITAVV